MKAWVLWCAGLCILVMVMMGAAQSTEKPVLVNLIVNFDVPQSASKEQLDAAKDKMLNLFTILKTKNIDWTLVLTRDASDQARLLLGQLNSKANIDIAISGNHSDEMLSTKSYKEQKAILEKSRLYAQSCKICGLNEVNANGFMPQSFNQNEDTYKVLDDLGFEYDAGFQAGILYAPGHENDVWPYKVENHKFYAVPVSTYMFSGKLSPLDDQYITDKGISASQWSDLLIGKFDEISGKDEPMVISLDSSISGSGDYMDALEKFLDYAASHNASFVGTTDLVRSRIGTNEGTSVLTAGTAPNTATSMPSTVIITSNASSVCPECDALKNATSISEK